MTSNVIQLYPKKKARPRGSNKEAWLLLVFIVLVIAILARLVMLGVVDASTLAAQSKSQRTTIIEVPALRGTIYDRNGNILAISVDATTIYVNPSEVVNARDTAMVLSEVLGGSASDYLDTIIHSASPTFAYIIRQGDPDQAKLLQERNEALRKEYIDSLSEEERVPAEIKTALTGIHYLTDSARVYPYGSVGAQVIGAVDLEGHGQSGLEQTYDSILRGIAGTMTVERGRDGTPMVGGVIEETAAVKGQDIIISIDIDLQQFIEESLVAASETSNSEDSNVLLLDGATGEILAAASLPLYERDTLTQEAVEAGATTLKCVTAAFEPGSVFKTVTAAAALSSDAITTEDSLFCPAELVIYDYSIKDVRERGDETMTLKTILSKSSNVGISLVEERIGNGTFAQFLELYGFGEYSHVDYPGETSGLLDDVSKWTPIQAANISFGQGIQVSSLQIASFYAAIANGGVLVQPHFLIARPQLDKELPYNYETILSTDVVEELEDILLSVVSEGTGRGAAIEGYEVAGKTGTAEKVSSEGGYLEDEYIVSFVGYIANSNSNIVCIASFDNPIDAMGNPPSIPLYTTIMEFVINRYLVVPIDEAVSFASTVRAPVSTVSAGKQSLYTEDQNSSQTSAQVLDQVQGQLPDQAPVPSNTGNGSTTPLSEATKPSGGMQQNRTPLLDVWIIDTSG